MLSRVQCTASILANCSNLHTLALMDQVEPATSGISLSLPSLHTLDVSRIHGAQSMEILKQIKAPCLTFMCIGHDNLHAVPLMLGHFWDTISTLSIHLPCCPPTPYSEQLPFLPAILTAANQVQIIKLIWHQPMADVDM
jgi:hypothetical protein